MYCDIFTSAFYLPVKCWNSRAEYHYFNFWHTLYLRFIYNIMILNEKRCTGKTLNLVCDCLWKAIEVLRNYANCSRIAMLHLEEIVFKNSAFCLMFIAFYRLRSWYPNVSEHPATIFHSKYFTGLQNPWTLDFYRTVYSLGTWSWKVESSTHLISN